MRRLAFAVSFFIAALDVMAGDAYPFQCNPSGNQQEMNACAVKDYKASDKVLNRKYKHYLSVLSPQSQEALRKEQRIWLTRRDRKCREEVRDSEGGSIWPLEFFGCIEAATVKRTQELEVWRSEPKK